MAYVKDIESLIGALAHGVIDPTQAWTGFEGLKDERVAQKQARKDALAEMLSSIQTRGYEAAKEGMPLDSVLADPTFSPARQKFGDDALKSLLAPYFDTAPTIAPEGADSPFPYAPNPGYGYSSVNPLLTPEDASDISTLLGESMGTAEFNPQTFFQQVMSELPREVAPEVSKLINDTLNQLKTRY